MSYGENNTYAAMAPSAVVAEFASRVNPGGMRVLDVSCGRGNNVLYLADHGFTDIVGMDNHPDMLMEARDRVRQLARETGSIACLFVDVDLQALDEPEASYDVVMANQVLHALPTAASCEKLLRDIMRFTKPAGYNVLSTQIWTPEDDNVQGKTHLLRAGELESFYKTYGWRVQYRSCESRARRLKGGRILPALDSLIARKPS